VEGGWRGARWACPNGGLELEKSGVVWGGGLATGTGIGPRALLTVQSKGDLLRSVWMALKDSPACHARLGLWYSMTFCWLRLIQPAKQIMENFQADD
jgi:hypothetical protein